MMLYIFFSNASLSTCHPETDFQAVLHVEMGNCDGACATNSDIEVDPPITSCLTGFGTTFTFDTVKDTDYFVSVSDGTNYDAALLTGTGTFGLTLTSFASPPNDECMFAELLTKDSNATIVGSTIGATAQPVCEGSKDYLDSTSYSRNVWYRFVGTGETMRSVFH